LMKASADEKSARLGREPGSSPVFDVRPCATSKWTAGKHCVAFLEGGG
jgi:hypothetical protein